VASTSFEKLRVYELAEILADQIWEIVVKWDIFAKDTVGKQITCAADSIGANIAEGTGRGSFQDNRRFVRRFLIRNPALAATRLQSPPSNRNAGEQTKTAHR
jgi:hypothetical protein